MHYNNFVFVRDVNSEFSSSPDIAFENPVLALLSCLRKYSLVVAFVMIWFIWVDQETDEFL